MLSISEPAVQTRPSGRRSALEWYSRVTVAGVEFNALQVFVHGSNISGTRTPCAASYPAPFPSWSTPPETKTSPVGRRVALASYRAEPTPRAEVATHCDEPSDPGVIVVMSATLAPARSTLA